LGQTLQIELPLFIYKTLVRCKKTQRNWLVFPYLRFSFVTEVKEINLGLIWDEIVMIKHPNSGVNKQTKNKIHKVCFPFFVMLPICTHSTFVISNTRYFEFDCGKKVRKTAYSSYFFVRSL